MAQLEMYPPIVNSPTTQLANAIDSTTTSIEVVDGARLPDAPNICTIGRGENPETILYATKSGNVLGGITRGFQGTAQAWQAGTQVARLFTAYDLESLQQNHKTHLAENVTDSGGVHGLVYEEGTFTPFWYDTQMDYSRQDGFYTRIGNLVFIRIHLTVSALNGASGPALIGGLPFRVANIGNHEARNDMIVQFVDVNLSSEFVDISTPSNANGFRLWCFKTRLDGSSVQLSYSDLTDSSTFRITGFYRI